jgi:hypothetical protein
VITANAARRSPAVLRGEQVRNVATPSHSPTCDPDISPGRRDKAVRTANATRSYMIGSRLVKMHPHCFTARAPLVDRPRRNIASDL